VLCGEPPFRREQGVSVMYAHLSEAPPPLTLRRPELPAAVDAVIARALAKAPAERYASCRDFAAALRSALSPEAAKAEPGLAVIDTAKALRGQPALLGYLPTGLVPRQFSEPRGRTLLVTLQNSRELQAIKIAKLP
jgi:hypothetical protein